MRKSADANLPPLVEAIQLWSEWRDSNSRHPAPKEVLGIFYSCL